MDDRIISLGLFSHSYEGRGASSPRDFMQYMMMDLFLIREDQAKDILDRYVADGGDALTDAEWVMYLGANRALYNLGYKVRGLT